MSNNFFSVLCRAYTCNKNSVCYNTNNQQYSNGDVNYDGWKYSTR